MRSLAKSRSRLSARVAVLAIAAAAMAGCSTDTSRFSDSPFWSSLATKPASGDVASAAPSGRVDAQNLPGPSRAVNVSSTGATRIAGANATMRPAPIGGVGGTHTAAAGTSGTHVVAPGETLTSIARLYGKSRVDVARANKIEARATVRVGQKLTILGVRHAEIKTASNAPAPARAAQGAPAAAPAKPQATAPVQVAANQPVATARLATPAAESPEPRQSATSEMTGAVPSFRWPVRGRVIAGYGAKVNGAPNDGINLAVPEGTSVKAAEDGVVAYAGNELKGYGNLVLVRHPNGFVTAYAHASELKVKRGDPVKRGQIVALAGQSGNVTSPQLHFEIRKGSSPIDPTQYLNGN